MLGDRLLERSAFIYIRSYNNGRNFMLQNIELISYCNIELEIRVFKSTWTTHAQLHVHLTFT